MVRIGIAMLCLALMTGCAGMSGAGIEITGAGDTPIVHLESPFGTLDVYPLKLTVLGAKTPAELASDNPT